MYDQEMGKISGDPKGAALITPNDWLDDADP